MTTGMEEGYRAIRAGTARQRMAFLLKDSVLYGGASAASRFLSIFTVPILTRVFSTAEYGVIDAIAVLGGVFASFATMGMDSAVARYFYETEDAAERREIVSQALLVQVVLALLATGVLLLQAERIVGGALAAPEYAGAFRLLAVALPFAVLVQFSRNLLKWVFARRQFLVVSLGSAAVVVALTVVLAAGVGMGVEGVFWAQIAGLGLFSALGLWYCRAWLTWPRSVRWVRPMLAFGWPYMLVGAFAGLVPSLDRVVTTRYLGLEAMGMYAVAYKVASLLLLPITGFQMAWGPFALALYREPDAAETYDRVVMGFTAAAALAAFSLAMLAGPLVRVFASERYLPAAALVLPLAFGLVIDALSWITGIGIELSKRTTLGVVSYFAGVGAGLGTMLLLVPSLGLAGVAWGMVAGRLALTVSRTLLAYRVWPVRFRLAAPALLLALALGTGVAAQELPVGGPWLRAALAVLLGAVLLAACWRVAAGTWRLRPAAPLPSS